MFTASWVEFLTDYFLGAVLSFKLVTKRFTEEDKPNRACYIPKHIGKRIFRAMSVSIFWRLFDAIFRLIFRFWHCVVANHNVICCVLFQPLFVISVMAVWMKSSLLWGFMVWMLFYVKIKKLNWKPFKHTHARYEFTMLPPFNSHTCLRAFYFVENTYVVL